MASLLIEESLMHILLVSTADSGGGAEQSAWNLFKSYQARGHKVSLAVGRKRTSDPDVLMIPNDLSRSGWTKIWLAVRKGLSASAGYNFLSKKKTLTRLDNMLAFIGEPLRWHDQRRGYEDFHYPGTRRLFSLQPRPDIIHCFNLHGGYFDLRMLKALSQEFPLILDLRDAWLLSGHCAHSVDCERWKIGCGECPNLELYPSVSRDGTAYNWQRKRILYAQSRVYVATPSQWLMRKVEQSILVPAIIQARVVPTGVDLAVYRPSDKEKARQILGLPQDAKVLLFAGNGVIHNVWKDYETVKLAASRVAKRSKSRTLFIALGEGAPPDLIAGQVEIWFVPFQKDRERVACYYQAADIYLHAAKADTFPRTILESMACGTPVVATAVGGIPEQVKSLDNLDGRWSNSGWSRHSVDDATGLLISPADAEGMAEAIERLLRDDLLCRRLGENAAQDARSRFDLESQANTYLKWYQELTAPTFSRISQSSWGASEPTEEAPSSFQSRMFRSVPTEPTV